MAQTQEGTTIDDVMAFLQEHMLTKEDAKQFATKEDVAQLRFDMDQRFAEINVRLGGVEQELKDINRRLTALEKRVHEDGNVYAREVIDLRRRVDILEAQVKKLEVA